MFGFGKKKNNQFPLSLSASNVTYAREQSQAYLVFSHVGLFESIIRTEWEIALFNMPGGQNFFYSMRHRIQHDYRDLSKTATNMRDLEEARHMAYAISLVYSAIFDALGKRLPLLENSMIDAYFNKRENFGLRAFSHFVDRLELFSGDLRFVVKDGPDLDLGFEVLVHINKSGSRSLGGTFAKAFVEILFNEIESYANEAEMNK
jgi:hypothetical protein